MSANVPQQPLQYPVIYPAVFDMAKVIVVAGPRLRFAPDRGDGSIDGCEVQLFPLPRSFDAPVGLVLKLQHGAVTVREILEPPSYSFFLTPILVSCSCHGFEFGPAITHPHCLKLSVVLRVLLVQP